MIITVEDKQGQVERIQNIVSTSLFSGATNNFVRPQTGAGITGGITTTPTTTNPNAGTRVESNFNTAGNERQGFNSIEGTTSSVDASNQRPTGTVTDPTTATGQEGTSQSTGGTTNPEPSSVDPTSGDASTGGGGEGSQTEQENRGEFNFALEHDDFDYGWDEEDEF